MRWRRRVRHPSRRRLLAWLEGGDDAIDAHLAGCERCASRLEDLSQPANAIGDALRAMLAPPPDLQPRLRSGIARQMRNREDMRLLVELLGLPWQTARAMSAPSPEDGRP